MNAFSIVVAHADGSTDLALTTDQNYRGATMSCPGIDCIHCHQDAA